MDEAARRRLPLPGHVCDYYEPKCPWCRAFLELEVEPAIGILVQCRACGRFCEIQATTSVLNDTAKRIDRYITIRGKGDPRRTIPKPEVEVVLPTPPTTPPTRTLDELRVEHLRLFLDGQVEAAKKIEGEIERLEAEKVRRKT